MITIFQGPHGCSGKYLRIPVINGHQISDHIPGTENKAGIKLLFQKRVVELAKYYGDRIKSWDVVNESSSDHYGRMVSRDVVCKSTYGLMPGNYCYESFRTADRVLPRDVLLNINEYKNDENYANQLKDLIARGCIYSILNTPLILPRVKPLNDPGRFGEK